MKPFFIFRFFPFFCQIAKRKVLIFCSQCFAYYTTTRENRELRPKRLITSALSNYTTTRENRELRPPAHAADTARHYTTTRENRELRHQAGLDLLCVDYTTTRENRELRPVGSEYLLRQNYTTTRENREPRQCDYIEEINFHHIVILAAAGSCAREGRIEHKKENTGTVLNMEENLSTGYTQSTTAR